MESGVFEKNCSNTDKTIKESEIDGEPPKGPMRSSNPSMSVAPANFSPLLAVPSDRLAKQQPKSNHGFLIKSPNGKLISLIGKNSILLKNNVPQQLENIKQSEVIVKKSEGQEKTAEISQRNISIAQDFVIKTLSGKPIIIPNKNPSTPSSKIKIDSASNTQRDNQVIKTKRKRVKINKSEDKFYQLQVKQEDEKPINKKVNHQRNKIFSRPPLCVESWSQTNVKLRDAACQTDVYVPPTLAFEQPIVEQDDCPNIPELIEFLLGTPEYCTGITETTKSNIINSTQKFKQTEMAQSQPTAKPALTLKERLFFDLRDCIGLDFLGNMPIHNAVLDEKINELKRQVYALRLRRFSVDVENNMNQTALQLAVINNKNLAIIETLLMNGAKVSVKDNLGNTLLHLAVLNTNEQVLDLILRYYHRDTHLMDIKNDEGLTPLMVAAIESKPELALILLKHGVNPNLQDDKSGRTALFHAVELNNASVVNVLLQNKADPKIRNFFGLTALDAVKEQNSSVANMMESRANPDSTTTAMGSGLSTVTPSTRKGANTKRKPSKRKTPEQPPNAKKTPQMAVVSKKLKVQLIKKLPEANNCASMSGVQYSQIKIRKMS